jgi:tRNA(fMet)-specific endonuclease VapC
MLDTNICIELLRAASRKVASRVDRFEIDEVAVSCITLAELLFGAERSARPAVHRNLITQFLAPIRILPFDDAAADTYGRVRAALERRGSPIGPLDTLIAGHALAVDLTLVTSNVREFARVDGLRVDNWLRS